MSARDELLRGLTGQSLRPPPRSINETNGFLDAYRADVLEEKAEEVFEDTRQKYSRVIATHGTEKAALWFTGREDAARLIAAPASGEATSAPDFFQPGHSYTRRDGTTFRCDAVTTHPESGVRLALGWHTDIADWTFLAHRDIGAWRYEYDGCEPPTEDTPCAVCGVSKDDHGGWNQRHLYVTPSARDTDATPGGGQ